MSGTDRPGRLPALGATLLRSLRTVARRGRSGPMPSPRRFLEPRLDLADVARYRALLGFTTAAGDGAGAAPLTWFYLLAQRAQLALMLAPRFPFSVLGLVHLENELVRSGTLAPEQPLAVEVAARPVVELPSGGATFTLDVALVQDGGAAVRCASTYLGRRGKGHTFAPLAAEPPRSWERVAAWDLEPSASRHYAVLSGDYNPMHLHPLPARLLGFRSSIAHGMHLAGLACAALERADGAPARSLGIRFLKPVELPARGLTCERAGREFRLLTGDLLHATGSWER